MAAGSTYTPIATTTLGSAVASYNFASISGAYTDLVLVCTYFKSAANVLGFQVNGDTANNYSNTTVFGNGSTTTSLRETNVDSTYCLDGSSASTTNPNIYIANFQNYSNTTTYKTILGRGGVASSAVGADVCLWRSTAAITSILVTARGLGTISTGTTLTLYGIAAA